MSAYHETNQMRKSFTFSNENVASPSEKIFKTNKTIVHHIDDTWAIGLLHFEDYGKKKTKTINIF